MFANQAKSAYGLGLRETAEFRLRRRLCKEMRRDANFRLKAIRDVWYLSRFVWFIVSPCLYVVYKAKTAR